ncbi:MAG TPA: beta-ketoacyl synthase N-terminal-like domain-containing protein, partial [Roseiflexaceae bacterium]|nr:beta-ketoacyl synthase N-terminal-like domain-containing protein [Roseiflexaceae bacterium]
MNSLSNTHATIPDLLRERALAQPDRRAYVFLEDGERETERLSYGELDARARAIAALLQREGAAGERVLLCLPAGLDYVAAFFGCLYAGAVAVPVYPPDPARVSRTLPRLQRVIADAQAAFALADRATAQAVRPLLADQAGLHWLTVEQADGAADDWRATAARPDDLALLMYTSGSTGDPKGVMVSHGNLMHNLAAFPGFNGRPCQGIVSWLPLYHDLGLLLGVLHPLFQGVQAVLMPPHTFVQRPIRWLAAIDRYRASASGGPNFAYDLCVRKTTPAERAALDLSCWTLALNGAEPLRPETLDRFTAAFAPHGFAPETHYPSYGMAEATATVTGGRAPSPAAVYALDRRALEQGQAAPGEGEQARLLVGCGQGLDGQVLLIVDPATGVPRPDGSVGEVWLSGPSVGQGYWNRSEETERTFRARPVGGDGRTFLRTGDMGFLRDGELVLTGRLKDLIIIRGVNHYPEDIEQTVERCHPALRPGCGAAFAVEIGGEERLVVVQEAQLAAPADAEAVFAEIRYALADAHALDAAAICLIAPGAIPKTSSGKIQRRACREQFLAGAFDTSAVWREPARPASAAEQTPADRSATEEWLLDYIARATGVERGQIAADQPFARYGLSSLQAVEMVAAIEARLGRALPQTVVWTYPTAQALASYLAGEGEAVVPTGAAAPSNEPIAIIGLGCRLPGANDARAFWELLCAGGDAISEIPPDRWDVNAFYSPDTKAPGKIATRWGGFLKNLDTLDAAFFGISPREAAHLDPRQRLMLEVAWEALEDAGIPFERVEGSRTGVFVATIRDDYERMLYEDFGRIDAYTGTGNAHSTVANRLSYVLGLHGPSMAVDTACSGSLVAIHLACQSLRSGDAALALAGGVSVILQPHPAMFLSRAGALSPDGRCKAFDHRANGYVRSEGAGVVVLKRLSEALADGDPIYAVIQGSAVNQDGHTNGMMAPSGAAQEAVLREAYGRAGIAPASVQYIEAHGTGTFLGDQIEARALGSVIGNGREPGRACRLGSAKSNVGHTEAAAGVTGLIKAALAIKHRHLPASIHIEQPNPRIPFDELGLAVQREPGAWPVPDQRLVAGVSSFGFGGTNAHVVLVEPPPVARPTPAESPAGQRYLLPLSARSGGALRDLVFAYSQHLLETDAPVEAICASAATRRSHHPQRLAVVGASRAELAEHLAERLADLPQSPAARPPLVFVFAGQGPKIGGVGPQLLEREPVFRAVIEECDRILRRYVDWSLVEEIRAGGESGRLDAIEKAHPAICSFQIALAALWRSWGVVPDVVLGQSMGELAAAHVAGVLSLEETLRTVVIRSQLMSRTVGQGKMAVVKISQEQAQLMLSAVDDLVSVAGVSSPESTVIAGDPATLDRLVASLERRGIFCRVPKGITVASHSPQMAPLVPELVAALADLRPQPPRIPMVSSVTGEPVGDGLLDAAYWGRNLRQPFQLARALAHLLAGGHTTFLEISPQAALLTIIEENGAHAGVPVHALASLRRDEDEQGALLASLGRLYSLGFDPNWRALFPQPAHAALPSYPWQRERYWLDQLPSTGAKGMSLRAAGGHPLLGEHRPVAAPSEQHVWEQDLCSDTLHFLAEHTLGGAVLLPGAAFVEMARAAADQAFGPGTYAIEGLDFAQALWLHETAARRVQVVVAPTGPDEASFLVFSRPAEAGSATPWTRHAAGVLRAVGQPAGEAAAVEALQARFDQQLSAAEHYAAMAELGIGYGPNFRGVAAIWRRDGEALGELRAPAGVVFELGSYGMHPALLDAAFQVVNAALPADGETLVPAGIAGARVYAPFEPQMWCHVALREPAGDHCADLRLFGADGRPIAAIDGLALQPLAGGWQPAQEPLGTWFYGVDWQETDAPAAQPGADRWLILGDNGGVGAALAAQIAGRGGRAVL